MRIIIVLLTGLIFCASCKLQQPIFQNNLYVQSITCQKWVSGVRNGGSGYLVNVILSHPLPVDFNLKSIQVFDKEAKLIKLDDLHYQANCYITMYSEREAIETPSSTTKLKPFQALLFYSFNGQNQSKVYNIVKELPLNPYPRHN
jgi:hypothetical protein